MTSILRAISILGLAGAAVALAACGEKATIDPADREQVARGKRVYEAHCASCHGRNLEGEPNWRERKPDGKLPAPPHDESGHTWHHTDDMLFRVTKHGLASVAGPGYKSDMPAYEGKLTDAEIRASLAYIKSRWPEAIRARQPRPR